MKRGWQGAPFREIWRVVYICTHAKRIRTNTNRQEAEESKEGEEREIIEWREASLRLTTWREASLRLRGRADRGYGNMSVSVCRERCGVSGKERMFVDRFGG